MKNGFTLVELSIVLVIIGLLIGGILVGQSLIDSAKLQAQIRQIQQFDIAFYSFENKFKSIPGDSLFFQAAGDGDGLIENDMSAGISSGEFQEEEEKANFWKHLSDSAMLPKSLGDFDGSVVASPSDWEIGRHAPEAVIKDASMITIFTTGTSASNYRNFWLITGTSSTVLGGMSVQQAAAIDAKLDDGLGYEFSDNRKTVYTVGTSCAGSGGPSSGPYELDQEQNCNLAIEIGLATDQ